MTGLVFLIGFVLFMFCMGGMFLLTAQVVLAASGQTDALPPADLQRLEGRWVRPDGGYVLELS